MTHDQIEAMTIGDRIVVMKDGMVQQFGAPLEIYDSPTNLFVAGFIGSPPMNFIQGKLVEQGSGVWHRTGYGHGAQCVESAVRFGEGEVAHWALK